MASKGRPEGSIPLFFLQVPEQLVKDFPVETLEFESWVEDLIQDQPVFKKRGHRKRLWRTPEGKLVEMAPGNVARYHPDWIKVE